MLAGYRGANLRRATGALGKDCGSGGPVDGEYGVWIDFVAEKGQRD